MRARNDKYFAPTDRPVKLRLCDHPDCGQAGDFRAPKSRDQLNAYYFFCLDHVREYNKAWDFFAGLSPEEVETYTRDATVWERPSWPLGQWGVHERALRDKAMHTIFGDAPRASPEQNDTSMPMPVAEREALMVMELQAPVDFTTIKNQYRALVKKHHPDLHGGAREAEEKFKNINQAFTTLRQIYDAATA
ncbi:MAG: J domain-containing protein [Alphaproteobacteria bacterium]|nr:J domain-containing protein [Alphaproteobacteria bacterium]